MNSPINNQRGVMAIGLALVMAGMVLLVANAIHKNLNMFLSTFNRNKAFYDAELMIEQVGKEFKQAYDLGQKIKPDLTDRWIIDTTKLKFNNRFYFESNQFCVDRSDSRLKGQICFDLNANSVTVSPITLNFYDHLKASQYALFKTILDLSNIAEAQTLDHDPSFPTLGGLTIPQHQVTLDYNDSLLTQHYGQFSCQTPKVPGTPIDYCVTFQFCTKYTGICGPEEMVKQTLLFSDIPSSDLEN